MSSTGSTDGDGADAPPGTLFPQELGRVLERLQQARQAWRDSHPRNVEQAGLFPSRQSLERISRELGTALFPLRLGPPELTARNENAYVAATLETTLSQLEAQIGAELRYSLDGDAQAIARAGNRIVGAFAAGLPDLRRALDEDVAAAFANDPAARSVDEVLIAYPSLTALIHYRIAHFLHRLSVPLVARLIAAIGQARTGIDIHPAARIGRGLFIDHGMGVVIGETAILGDRVRLHQGVTLGGDPGGEAVGRRHPHIEDDVVILPNASIVGAVTIGARSRIGGHVWLTHDVPADSIVEAPPPAVRRGA